MTSIHFKIYELVAVLSCTFVLIAHSKPTASFNPSQWELSWSDEFDYTGKPNPEIWDYEHGYLGFNEELQNYTDHPDNVRVVDGILIIEAHLKDVSAQRSRAIVKELKGSNAKTDLLGTQEFTSARLITRGKKEFVHSRVEARARFTTGRGTWPAIWLLGDESKNPWPLCGDMDIMEHVGYDDGMIHGSIHTEEYNHMSNTQKSGSKFLSTATDSFHVYSLEWSPNYLRYLIDNEPYFFVYNDSNGDPKKWPFDEPVSYTHLTLPTKA